MSFFCSLPSNPSAALSSLIFKAGERSSSLSYEAREACAIDRLIGRLDDEAHV